MPQIVGTAFADLNATSAKRIALSPDRFCQLITRKTLPTKAAQPLFSGCEFGDQRSDNRCLRHDGNVTAVRAVVGDHDAGTMSLFAAASALEDAGLCALLYTTARHTEDSPRWRCILPTSGPVAASDHRRLVDRANGVLRGVLSPESWTLSQSWYVGTVIGATPPETAIAEGRRTIDECVELDAIAIGKPAVTGNGAAPDADGFDFGEGADADVLAADIAAGNGSHVAATRLAGLLVREGVGEFEIVARLEQAYNARATDRRDAGWHKAVAAIPKLVRAIITKDASKPADPALDQPVDAAGTWPAPLADCAKVGLVGAFLAMLEGRTEADEAALAFSFMAEFGSIVGRGPHYLVEGRQHPARLSILLVGDSSKARKGTSHSLVRQVFRAADQHWHTSCYATGLASGEGLISRVRDPIIKADPKTGMDETIDPGVTDKRLLVFAGEFASILAVMSRAGNILGGLLRQASDGEDLHNESKNNPLRATAPHITVEGHITQRELTAALDTTSVYNGFMNRFLVVCCRRSCELPFGDEDDPVDPVVFGRFVAAVSAAVALADRTGRIRMDDAAKALWRQGYSQLSAAHPGMFGAATGRAEMHVVRLSVAIALLCNSQTIGADHLRAALEFWRYAADSARHIWGDKLGDPVADTIITELRRAGAAGKSRNDLYNLLGRNISGSRIAESLSVLLRAGMARVERRPTAGRPQEVWFAVTS